jgi:hypothetical protein
MPVNLLIEVPDSIKTWQPFLLRFFKGMMDKLDKNSWKQTPKLETLPRIMELLKEEIEEFESQLEEDRFNENSLVELMDQANFAFLAYVALRMEGVKHGSEESHSKLG